MTSMLAHDTVFAALVPITRRLCQNALEGMLPETKLDDVAGLDSLRLLEAVALLEEYFSVQVDTDRLSELTTIGDIISLIVDGEHRLRSSPAQVSRSDDR